MDWPPLEQCGALPAGGSWQLQERSLPGGRSEVLKQLHVLNEKFKNKGVDFLFDLHWAFLWGEGLGPAIFKVDF